MRAGIDTNGGLAGIAEVKVEVLAETLLCENDVNEWNDTLRGDTNLMAAAPELLAALQYVSDLTGTALTKEQAETLGKRCRAAIAIAVAEGGAS